jgi:hypothetical protein
MDWHSTAATSYSRPWTFKFDLKVSVRDLHLSCTWRGSHHDQAPQAFFLCNRPIYFSSVMEDKEKQTFTELQSKMVDHTSKLKMVRSKVVGVQPICVVSTDLHDSAF